MMVELLSLGYQSSLRSRRGRRCVRYSPSERHVGVELPEEVVVVLEDIVRSEDVWAHNLYSVSKIGM
jgi:hypothetical protein